MVDVVTKLSLLVQQYLEKYIPKKDSISNKSIVLINSNVTSQNISVSTAAIKHQKSVVENLLSYLVTLKILIVQMIFQRMLFFES